MSSTSWSVGARSSPVKLTCCEVAALTTDGSLIGPATVSSGLVSNVPELTAVTEGADGGRLPGKLTGRENGSAKSVIVGGAITRPAVCGGTAYFLGSGATSGIVNTTSVRVGQASVTAAVALRRT